MATLKLGRVASGEEEEEREGAFVRSLSGVTVRTRQGTGFFAAVARESDRTSRPVTPPDQPAPQTPL